MLLVDVDGVISLFGFDHGAPPPGLPVNVDGIPHWISTGAGALLQRLNSAFQCVWCTGWEEKAEEHLPLALGLNGGWPHLVFHTGSDRHWKLDAIDAFAGPDRPLAWIDDAHDDTCQLWATSRPGPTLLVATDPAVGLTELQTEELLVWARDLHSS